ncbi:hypothetical protein JCM11251_005972 [Rhodosporidiobolus azoricus]
MDPDEQRLARPLTTVAAACPLQPFQWSEDADDLFGSQARRDLETSAETRTLKTPVLSDHQTLEEHEHKEPRTNGAVAKSIDSSFLSAFSVERDAFPSRPPALSLPPSLSPRLASLPSGGSALLADERQKEKLAARAGRFDFLQVGGDGPLLPLLDGDAAFESPHAFAAAQSPSASPSTPSSPSSTEPRLLKVRLEYLLGKGIVGEVYADETGFYAVKEVRRRTGEVDEEWEFRWYQAANEGRMNSLLDGKVADGQVERFWPQYYGMFGRGESVYLVFERVNGGAARSWKNIVPFADQLTSSLELLHSTCRVYHGDLRSHNILLSPVSTTVDSSIPPSPLTHKLYLVDFGRAGQVSPRRDWFLGVEMGQVRSKLLAPKEADWREGEFGEYYSDYETDEEDEEEDTDEEDTEDEEYSE